MGEEELTRPPGVQDAQSNRLFHEFHYPARRLRTTGRNDIHCEVHADRGSNCHGVAAPRRELLQPASNQILDARGDTGK